MKVKTLSTVLAALVLAVGLAGQDRVNEMKLQQAIDLLETRGDTARAIPLLEEVSRSKDDAVAARALLYLGQAQEGAGKEQARRTYERIIQQFANQLQIAAQARTRLSALSSGNLAKSGASGLAHRVVSTLRQE